MLLAAAVLGAGTQPVAAQWFDWGNGNPFGYQERRPPPPPRRARPQPQQQQGFGFNFPFFGGGGANQSGPSFWEPEPQQPRRRPAREPNRAPRSEPSREAARSAPPVDASKAPPPRRADPEATQTVLVLGDSMADWLAYGLEDTFADGGEFNVVRKVRPGIGLVRTEPRDYDWLQGAREAAGEKASFIVVMLGLADRKPIRERQSARSTPANAAGAGATGPNGAGSAAGSGANPSPTKEGENAEGEPPSAGTGPTTAPTPEPDRAAQTVSYDFRTEKWAELYGKRVDETIAALKAKRVPVIWVGLPPIRAARMRPELSFLNDLYRERAQKAGIAFVDVWDGFVDEGGDFAAYGPDVIGQVRRLRAADGTHFTRAGARKLAHYVDREIRRLLSRETPVALPVPEEPQKGAAPPAGVAARPASGPVVPLAGGAAPPAEALVGARAAEAAAADPSVAKVLREGQPVEAPRGRADDFAWSEARANLDPQATDPPPAEAITATRPARPRAQVGQAAPRAAPTPPPRPAASGANAAPPSPRSPR